MSKQKKRKETLQEKALAESMLSALEKEHGYKLPEPRIVTAFHKETLRTPQEYNTQYGE